MPKCSECGHDFGPISYAFCLHCGTRLVSGSELPTLPNVKAVAKRSKSEVEENVKLRREIEKLKETSATLFGTTQERVQDRVERILTVSGFKSDIVGKVDRALVDKTGEISYRTDYLPGYVSKFQFYKRSAEEDTDTDEVRYVATYSGAGDFEKELSDIRRLLSDCDAKELGCTFVMATNEDLTTHKREVNDHFNEIRTVLPPDKRDRYQLEIWDQGELLTIELALKIKVRLERPAPDASDQQ